MARRRPRAARQALGHDGVRRQTRVAIRSAIGIESFVWLTDIAGLTTGKTVATMQWSARSMFDAPRGDSLPATRSNTTDQRRPAARPPQHDFPLRLVVPGWYGMAHVKWLRDITLIDAPFEGYQQAVAYRFRQDAGEVGEPVERIAPRALMIPPGFPDFMSRVRVVRPGSVRLEGRAWSGRAPVTVVDVTDDGGRSWQPAELQQDSTHRWAWQRWESTWTATAGHHILGARATDAEGTPSP